MKKIVSGASVLLTGAILFLSMCIAGSMNTQYLMQWDGNTGKLWASIADLQLMPIVIISIVIMVAGLCVIIWGNMSKSEHTN